MKPEIAYIYNKLKQLRFDFHKTDFSDFRNNYRYDPTLNRYVRKDDNDLYIAKDTFKPLEEELEYADKCHTLEEQIGCPLEVLFRALKDGIYHDEKFENPVLILDEDSFKKNNLSLLVVGTIVYLKEYKKTWWLREDKSE